MPNTAEIDEVKNDARIRSRSSISGKIEFICALYKIRTQINIIFFKT
tara:strand:- start:326 stop:466 length:141 start_codon:yes stop_codon:yes gene_type:complete